MLEESRRAFGRMAAPEKRPLRIGIFGETNSGKSSLANLLVGVSTLPAHPVKNTRLPTLLKYAPTPFVAALYESGERITLPANDSIPQILAAFYESGGRIAPHASQNVPQGAIKWLEVGLPSGILRSVEILDFPGSADALAPASREDPARYDLDAAIWVTVATQAWRASEQTQWLELPAAIRSRSLLAVTYCDMVAGGKKDLKKLRARLETSAMPYFQGICFVNGGNEDPAAAASENRPLFAQLRHLAQDFSAKRIDKARAIAPRVIKKAIDKAGLENHSAALAGKASEFADKARARINELRGTAMTRRDMLMIGLGAGAAIAVAGGGIGVMYAVTTPSEPQQPFIIDQPILTFTGHTAWIHSVAFSPDGRTLLSSSGDNVLKLWDAASGGELRSFAEFPDDVRSAVFSPDGRAILCGSGNMLILLDAVTGKTLRTFKGHSDGIPAVAFSPDGRTALSGSWDKTLKLWDVAGGDELRTFTGHTGDVYAVAFSPDGRTLLSGSRDGTLKLWDAVTGQELSTFAGHTDWVRAAAFSPGGRTALSSSTDKTLRLWDIASGKELSAFSGQARDFSPVRFSPDGRTFLSGGYMTLKLWDVTTGSELGTFTGHAGEITAVTISPDGRTAVSGSMDKTLKLWDIPPNLSVSARL